MNPLEEELVQEVSARIAASLEQTEIQPGSNAFVLAGPFTLLRPDTSVSQVPQPPKVTGTFRGFYAT